MSETTPKKVKKVAVRNPMPTEEMATYAEIAKELGVSPERARQIEQKALYKLNRLLRKAGINPADFFGEMV